MLLLFSVLATAFSIVHAPLLSLQHCKYILTMLKSLQQFHMQTGHDPDSSYVLCLNHLRSSASGETKIVGACYVHNQVKRSCHNTNL